MSEILSTIWAQLFGCTIPVIGINFRDWCIGIFILGFLIDYIRERIKHHQEIY